MLEHYLLPVDIYCIPRIASGGYYGPLRMSMPLPPPQCQGFIGRLLKFSGYIHNHKILPRNIFGLILKNQDGCHGRFLTFSKEFCWPSRTKGIIGRYLKFAAYVHHYKILTENIFDLILKNKMAATGVSFQS